MKLSAAKWLVLTLGIVLAAFTVVAGPARKAAAAPYNLAWYVAGPGPGICTQIIEPSDPNTWNDNYLCAPTNLGLYWSYGQAVPAGYPYCNSWNEPSDPYTWGDNRLCTSTDLGLRFSNAGPISGMDCISVNEPADPNTWNDNYLCGPATVTPPTPPPPTPPPPTPPPPPPAEAKPYFITQFGGPFAGGAFKDASDTCSTNYQSPYDSSGSTDYYKGAIMAFGTVSGAGSRQGAHSSLDAFALGKIEGNGDPAKKYGFYTGTGSSDTGGLSFSNSGLPSNDFWGGNLEGLLSYSHCIADYYDKYNDAPTDPDYQKITGNTTLAQNGNLSIPAGERRIMFVDGDVTIAHNVLYAPHNASNIPKFALVVKGNIYISPDVDQLDGWYIAQPDTNIGGEIWTCHDGSTKPTDQWMRDNCGNKQLTINGAITAAHVYLGRISGDLGGSPAESVNFSPEMVLGGAFFNETSAGADSTGAIQSLISLPPIF